MENNETLPTQTSAGATSSAQGAPAPRWWSAWSWHALRGAHFSRQLSVAVSVAILGLALFSSATTTRAASGRMQRYMMEQGVQITANLAGQSVLALLYHSADNAQSALKVTLAFPDVVQVGITDVAGKVLVRRTKDKAIAPLPPLVARGTVAVLERETDGAFYFSAPVFSEPQASSPFEGDSDKPVLLGHVQVVVGKSSLDHLVWSLFVSTVAVTVGFAAVLLWLIRRVTRQLMRPLEQLSGVMRRAERGESKMRATLHGPQDIVEMGKAFNKMMDVLEEREAHLEHTVQKRTHSLELTNRELAHSLATVKGMQSELARSEKMAALGSLVAGVAHELNTPIGNCLMTASTLKAQSRTLLGNIEAGTLRRSLLDEYARGTVEGIDILERNLFRASELISSFKSVAVDQTSDQRRVFNVKLSVEETLRLIAPMHKKLPYKLILDVDQGLEMDSYPGALGQVITNFMSNAIAHAFDGREAGTMRLAIHAQDDDQISLTFADDGAGIPLQHQARVFDPFFTTKMGRGGSGLGLNIVYNIVTDVLGGRITLGSQEGVGTTFTVILPRAAGSRG
jgi:signal transduction histidine kinase